MGCHCGTRKKASRKENKIEKMREKNPRGIEIITEEKLMDQVTPVQQIVRRIDSLEVIMEESKSSYSKGYIEGRSGSDLLASVGEYLEYLPGRIEECENIHESSLFEESDPQSIHSLSHTSSESIEDKSSLLREFPVCPGGRRESLTPNSNSVSENNPPNRIYSNNSLSPMSVNVKEKENEIERNENSKMEKICKKLIHTYKCNLNTITLPSKLTEKESKLFQLINKNLDKIDEQDIEVDRLEKFKRTNIVVMGKNRLPLAEQDEIGAILLNLTPTIFHINDIH